MSQSKLVVLEAKKEALFGYVQNLYDSMKHIKDDKSKRETFLAKCMSLDSTKEAFNETIDDIVSENLALDEKYKPNYQAVSSFMDLFGFCRYQENELRKSSSKAAIQGSTTRKIKLEQLEIPKFDGDPGKWPDFYHAFKEGIHENVEVTKVHKMQYLVSKLIGNAKGITKGLQYSESNYDSLWTALVSKYEDKRWLVNYELDVLQKFKVSKATVNSLSDFIDQFGNAVKALKSFKKLDVGDYLIFSIAVGKLDKETVEEFEMERTSSDFPTFDELITFVEKKRNALRNANRKEVVQVKSEFSQSSKKSFFVENKNYRLGCSLLCGKNHDSIAVCEKFLEKSPQERFAFIKEKELCINCFRDNHKVFKCKDPRKCSKCEKRHHLLLHFDEKLNNNISESKAEVSKKEESSKTLKTFCTLADPEEHSLPFLCTAKVLVNKKLVRIIMDNASHMNLITEICCRRLSLPVYKIKNRVISINGVNKRNSVVKGFTHFAFSSRFKPEMVYFVIAMVLDEIAEALPEEDFSNVNFSELAGVDLADETFHIPGRVEAIIGADLFPHLLQDGKIFLNVGPVALNTTLGYVVSGRVGECNATLPGCYNFLNLSIEEFSLKRFWEIEEIPSGDDGDNAQSEEYGMLENLFLKLVIKENGRYRVPIMFKEDPSLLGDSFELAKNRFYYLEKRLEMNPELKLEYHKIINDYLKQGHLSLIEMEKVEGYFIPHHAVFKPSSISTKTRIVFDGSAKSSSGKSLNDLVYVGPKLQADIFLVLLAFRLNPVALSADIKQMYRQIGILEQDRKYQRIVFRFDKNEPLKIYELNTVTFGIASSPFLALRTVKQLCDEESENFQEAVEVVREQIYMDDLPFSTSEKKAVNLQKDLVELFKRGGFEMTKWVSNSKAVLDQIPDDYRADKLADNKNLGNILKVLGLEWDYEHDLLIFNIHIIKTECTKRNILSNIAKQFDPLGLLSPMIVVLKLIIKDLWLAGVDWEETPPKYLVEIWQKFCQEIVLFNRFTFDRFLGVVESCSFMLVGFSDASIKAYGAVIYSRVVMNGEVVVKLVCAKSKVAPVKVVSLPRLELCGAWLLSKLMKVVKEKLEKKCEIHEIFCLSDSTVALHWIASSASKWQTFVANRVGQVQANVSPTAWFHVSGKENPADFVSRGLTPKQFHENDFWTRGPEWLSKDPEEWPVKRVNYNFDNIPEGKKFVLVNVQREQNILVNLEFSSWSKTIRVIVLILRFCKILEYKQFVEAKDLEIAEKKLLIELQRQHFSELIENLLNKDKENKFLRKLNPFLGKDELIRVGGRLGNSPLAYEARHPVLLPKGHFANILIEYYHRKNLHCGPSLCLALLRQKYWIVNGRNEVKRVIAACNKCFRNKPVAETPLMGNLPEYRFSDIKPFYNTGVDYAGPINITLTRHRGVRSQKAYICLFICMATKAIHIELVSDLSTEAFLAAFRRFLSRRGSCKTVYSDCGSNFIGARRRLHELFELIQSTEFKESLINNLMDYLITWKFNPPRAPHFGGLWESNIKSVKSILYNTIGEQLLSYEELNTVLIQIEALLNSRPLCALTADTELEALTPAHFLTLTPLKALPAEDVSEVQSNKLDRFRLINKIVQSYWKRWKLEYLNSLQERTKWLRDGDSIQLDTIVVLKDDSPPLQWKIGLIVGTYPGKDGVVRVVDVRVQDKKESFKTFKRPVHKICVLPTQ